MAIAAAFALVGLILLGQGLFIKAKAAVAQFLLERAFAASLASGKPVKPWGWADTAPMARLEVPRLGADAIVLEGGSGQALAFGPAHLENTPQPGEEGASVIAAHRDTHFDFLGRLKIGDEILVQRIDGATVNFRVVNMSVVPWDASGIDPQAEGHWLILSTCWPLSGVASSPLRYIVRATLSLLPPP